MGLCTSRIQQNDQFQIYFSSPEKVEFDTTQSHLVSFAIDYQSHEKFKAKTLDHTVVTDAKLVLKTFVQIGSVTEGNTTLHIASKNPEDCTFEGVRRCFIDAAKSVGAEGMFVFHFSGHGIRIGDDHALAPSDFDCSDRTCITASVLNNWLTEASCKAKHVLFTLDCCYAGGIGDALTTIILHSSLFVMCACTANETSRLIGPLEHSVFSYFLADAMRKETSDPQKLPLYKILTECRTCCKALSSLLVKYEAPRKVSSCEIHPQTFTSATRANSNDETDSVKILGRYLFVTKHYDLEAPTLPLHRETKRWLSSIDESIAILGDRNLLKGKVLITAVSSIMTSIVSYQLAFESDTVSHPNTFIIAFQDMASCFEHHCPDMELSIDHFRYSWGFYDQVLLTNRVDDANIKALRHTILKENTESTDEDECDGGQNEVWIPL